MSTLEKTPSPVCPCCFVPANDFYSRIIESPVFTFVIGEEKVPVTIHTALVEAHSRTLYRIMTEKHNKDSLSETTWL